jgi:hypothetical protein
VCKVLLSVITGEDGHVETGIIWKPDLQDLRFLLGSYDICLGNIRDGWPFAQLPFLALEFFNLSGALRVVLILAYCQSPVLSTSFSQETLAELVGTQPLDGGLKKKCRVHKFLVPKNSCLCRFCTYDRLDGLVQFSLHKMHFSM